MAANVVTTEDLEVLKKDLIQEFNRIITASAGQPAEESPKAWLKAAEVRKFLGISAGTLLTLRLNGSLPFSKIGAVLYFKREDIEKLLEQNHHDFRNIRNPKASSVRISR